MIVPIKILFFAKAREITEKPFEHCEIETPISYSGLLEKIVKTYNLDDIKNAIILSVNEEYCIAEDTIHLKAGDEIAVIPPLNKLEVGALTELATSAKCGAISIFVGTTRDNFENKIVTRLEYEAYETMALKSLEKICGELRCQWTDIENIVIYHRLGVVPVKEASIFIGISSPHRTDAIKATETCIDKVKRSVPIWKKEFYEDSFPQWKENKECVWSTCE